MESGGDVTHLLEQPHFAASILLLQLIDGIAQLFDILFALMDTVNLVSNGRHVTLHVAHLLHWYSSVILGS